MQKCLLAIAVSFFAQAIAAQDSPELASVGYAISRLKKQDSTYSTEILEVSARFPVYQKGGNRVAGVFNYKNVVLDGFPMGFASPLQGFSLNLGWETLLTERKSLAFYVQNGLFPDFKDISGKDTRYGMGFRYKVRRSQKFSTGFGLGYARQFFGNQIVPFIYLHYQPNERLTLSGQFPMRPKLQYQVNPKNTFALELVGDASSYRLAETLGNGIVQVSQWRAAVKWERKAFRYFEFFAGLGINLRNTYKQYGDADKVRWTVFTLPIGEKQAPAAELSGRGAFMQLGLHLAVR